ncbi:MAG: hypothetical protein AB8B96_19800 [Lysobacterales bacterium]
MAVSSPSASAVTQQAFSRNYDIVYVRQPRFGDQVNTIWPEVFHPGRLDAGADLMLLHPDGSEEVLLDCENCSVTDPVISFDAQWVYYSLFPDLREASLNYQRGDLPYEGADIYRMNLQSRQIERLTFGKFTPNLGAGNWDESNPVDPPNNFNRLGYGILNLGPMPLPGNRLAFTSNRNGQIPTKGFTNPTLQLFVMDVDGENVEQIAPMNIGSALHPTILKDGRLIFSSYESQGIRDRRVWGIWSIYPDGRHWEPVVSSLSAPEAYHFMTQTSNENIVVEAYYNLNNNGFGALYGFPVRPPAGVPAFGSAFPSENPPVDETRSFGPTTFQIGFTPYGYHAITPMTHMEDNAAPLGDDGTTRVGKFTHPSATTNNDLLVVWTPGPANDLNRPTQVPRYDAGLYVIENSTPAWSPDNLRIIKNDPAYNEAWPRAVVPYSAVHGVTEPATMEWLPNNGSEHSTLPAGTPHGLVGSSSFYKRESFPGRGNNAFDGLDAFNTAQNEASSNWAYQGADAGLYDDAEIWAVRVLAMEGNTARLYGPNASELDGTDFHSHANERLRILGEIPLRKAAGINDAEGNPDTSVLFKIPADTPFTFQTLDRNGIALNMTQTWHQVRPGEVRTDCGGCHAHSQMPLAFEGTAASRPDYEIYDLSRVTPMMGQDDAGSPTLTDLNQPAVNVEFYADIRPMLQQHCVSCHNTSQNAGNLNLNDLSMDDNLPGDYRRLADDRSAQFGYPSVISNSQWRQTNASRYVRMFQSRRSLLTWQIFGARLDGWSNDDHPTESTPGDASTLPQGANANNADLDYVPSSAHPAGGMPSLTRAQRMTFARWIDLGAPIDVAATRGNPGLGWFLDDLRPTLTVSSPRPNYNAAPPSVIRLGMTDAYTGISEGSLSVIASFTVQGRPPRSELSDLAVEVSPDIFEIALGNAFATPVVEAHVLAEVADNQGNVKRVDVRFSTVASGTIFIDSFE